LGSLDGVYATNAAWRGGHEVVTLLYDPDEIKYETLVEKAKQFKCTSQVFTYSNEQLEIAKRLVGSKAIMANDSQRPRSASKSDQLYHLSKSPLRSLPMCRYQMMKINAAISTRKLDDSLLSPRQVKLANAILDKSNANAISGLVSPSGDNDLGEYTAKLKKALAIE